jgi:hypothetical protein
MHKNGILDRDWTFFHSVGQTAKVEIVTKLLSCSKTNLQTPKQRILLMNKKL